MIVTLDKVECIRTVVVYWNRVGGATTPFIWQSKIDLPFIPDYACLKNIACVSSDITHNLFVQTNLDRNVDMLYNYKSPESESCDHYFEPNLATIRGGMATFQIFRGDVVVTSQQNLQPPNPGDGFNIGLQFEFYKLKK